MQKAVGGRGGGEQVSPCVFYWTNQTIVGFAVVSPSYHFIFFIEVADLLVCVWGGVGGGGKETNFQ